MLYAQFTHAIGLNDVADALQANRAAMAAIRGAEPPSRNGLSHANRTRDPKMAEALFWAMIKPVGPGRRRGQAAPSSTKSLSVLRAVHGPVII